MKQQLALLILIFFFYEGYTQQLGVYGNAIVSNTHSNIKEEAFLTSNIGIEYHFKSSRFLKYTTNLAYEQKGSNYTYPTHTATFRVNYITLKGATKIELNTFDVQLGPYIGFLTFVDAKPDDRGALHAEDFTKRVDFGLSLLMNQYLFRVGKTTYHLRGEANYGLINVVKDGLFTTDSFDRNFTFGLGFAARWDFRD